jgi:hypothetical protein
MKLLLKISFLIFVIFFTTAGEVKSSAVKTILQNGTSCSFFQQFQFLTTFFENHNANSCWKIENDLLMNVSQRQFNRLERRFNKDTEKYENYREKLSAKNGYYTFSIFGEATQNENGYTLPRLEMSYFEPGHRSYSEQKYFDRVMTGSNVGTNVVLGERGLESSPVNVEDVLLAGMAVKGLISWGMKILETQVAVKWGSKLPTQMHHFAINKHSVYTPLMEDVVKPFGLKLDGSWNKVAMPHVGRHPNAYHEFVLRNMRNAADAAGGSQATFLQLYNNNVIQPVLNNPLLLRKIGW